MKYQKKKLILIINIVFLVALGINAGMACPSKLDFESGSDNFLEGAYLTKPPSGSLSEPEVPDKWKEVIVLEELEDGAEKVEYLNEDAVEFIISSQEVVPNFVYRVKPENTDKFQEELEGIISEVHLNYLNNAPLVVANEEAVIEIKIKKIYERNILKVEYFKYEGWMSEILSTEQAEKISVKIKPDSVNPFQEGRKGLLTFNELIEKPPLVPTNQNIIREITIIALYENGEVKIAYDDYYLDMQVTKILNPQQASMITLK